MAPKGGKGASSLSGMAQQKIIDDLKESITEQARAATFACGGSLPVKDAAGTDSETAHIDPIQIRFGENQQAQLVTLPADATESPAFQKLLAACTPASFGRGGNEVIDEDYRKASKLDPTAFLTSFCPYQAGIVDIISQLLLPNGTNAKDMRSVKAELYKLNVYSAPSGKFKPHVDTPRSDAQFASLVVALPVGHKGGELIVRNSGKQVVFDWSTAPSSASARTTRSAQTKAAALSNPSAIQWAAFYSDCEHEVLEVTAGHRVTLTYNLYVTRGSGNLAGHAVGLNPTQLPIYEILQGMLDSPGCFPCGRVLGIWLTHSYAHTNAESNFLPSSLKGADMVFYETALALGLQCYVRPIMSFKDEDEDDEEEGYSLAEPVHLMRETFSKYKQDYGCASDDDILRETLEQWSNRVIDNSKVTWLNTLRRELEEPAMGYATYGNEPTSDVAYSAAALLIRIPPRHERLKKVNDVPASMFDGIEAEEENEAEEEPQEV